MFRKLKIRMMLLTAVGAALILALLIGFEIMVNSSLSHLSSISADLYQHPFMVNRSAMTIRHTVNQMRDRMLEFTLSGKAGNAGRITDELLALDNTAMENFRVVETNFLGDPEKAKEVHRLLEAWDGLRIRAVGLAESGQWGAVEDLVMNANKTTYVQLLSGLDYIIDDSSRRAEMLVDDASIEASKKIDQIGWLIAGFVTALLAVWLEILRRILGLISAEELAAEKVRQDEKSYRSLFGNMLEGYARHRMIYVDGQPRDYIFLDTNPAFENLTGLRDVVGKKVSEVVPGVAESNPELLEIYGRVAMSGKSEQFETFASGLGMWFSVSVYSVEKECFVTVFTNITERKVHERQLALDASIFHHSSEAMLIADAHGHIISTNPAFAKITGYGADEVTGKHVRTLCSHHDEAFYKEIKDALAEDGHWEGEIWDVKKSGVAYAVYLVVNAIPGDENGLNYAVQFTDITEKKRMEEAMSWQANFDPLTGLANRRLFRDHLEHELRKTRRSGNKLALMYIDLDRFKEVNDTQGHHVGDQLLVEAATRIVGCVREADIVARLGGDEFTVILSEVTEVSRIENVAHSIIQSLSNPYRLEMGDAFISASIGITVYPDDATESSDLLRNADQAMYLSKSAGRSCYHFFTGEMQEAVRKHHQLAHDLHGAFSEKQFLLYYQPIVDLRSGGIFKAETLLRWQHPDRGMIEPAEFIPVAEEIGMIDEIGDWVFNESLKQGRQWSRLIGHTFRIGVNISPVQLMAKGHNNVWISHVHEMKIVEQSVSIEITEGSLLNNRPEVFESLAAVHAAGMEVAIDDFGTGYSSLSYLQKFKIEYLKIDQSFIRNLAPDSTDMVLSEAIIVMAHKLGMKVIAEGIETAEQRDLLIAAGCDFGQGYLFSRPVPAAEFEKLLNRKLAPGGQPVTEPVAHEHDLPGSGAFLRRKIPDRRDGRQSRGRRDNDRQVGI